MSRLSTAPKDGHARRAKETSDRILAAADEILAARGYRAARVEQIAARAQVAPASVYNHFGSKAGVSRALADRALASHEIYVAPTWSLDVTPLLRLIAAGGATLRFAAEEPSAFRTMAMAYLDPGDDPLPAAAAARIGERIGLQRRRLAAGIEAAAAEGELRELDVAGTVEFLLGAWTGVILMGMRPQVSAATRRTLAVGLRALVAGLAGPRALTADGALRRRYLRAIDEAIASGP